MIKILHKVLELIDFAAPVDKFADIRAKQIKLLNDQISIYILIVEGIVATCVFMVLWGISNHEALIVWLLYMYSMSGLLRVWLRRLYMRNQLVYSNMQSTMLFICGALLSGLGWGACVLFMPNDNFIYQNFIVVVIFGVTSAATNIYSPILVVYIIFIFVSYVPLCIWFFFQGGVYIALTFLSLCYLIVLIASVFHISKLFKNCLILTFKNESLALNEKCLNDELVIASRYAGMAEIATSVLHNVGNVLTSANISVTMIRQKICSSKLSNIEKIGALIEDHKDDFTSFFTQNPKGQLLPNYLIKISKSWADEKNYLLDEVGSLTSNIQHIKEIITKQNNLGMTVGTTQKVNIPELIEDALKLNQLSCEQAYIEITRDFQSLNQDVLIDRVKVLQVIVNLIKNAVESCIESNKNYKSLKISLLQVDNAFIKIEIKDNGQGISRENLHRIFHQGFTTKSMGHGFGLHSSSFSAQEMGGDLQAHSDGIAKGATFALILPYHPQK